MSARSTATRSSASDSSRPLRIGVVTQYFSPETVPFPISVPVALAERGHSVRVVTGFPNYPAGRLFPGYRQRFGVTEQHGAMRVRRCPIWISHSRNPLGRILNYLSFAVSSLSASRFLRDADVVYVYATQMTAALAPFLWRKLRGTPYVLHVQDLWPESITGSGMVGGRAGAVISALLRPLLRRAYRSAAATIGITPSMTRALVERGVPADRAGTVWNWAPPAEPDPKAPAPRDERRAPDGTTRVLYAGNLGRLQDLETVLHAFARLADEPITLDVLGDGVAEAELRALARSLGLTRVRFHGRVGPAEVAARAARADYQLIPLRDLPVFRMTIPSKFQAGLAQGLPVVTNVAGDLADLVLEHGLGFVAAPGDPDDLARAIRDAAEAPREARDAMSRAARRLSDEQMSIERGVERIERILLRATAPDPESGE